MTFAKSHGVNLAIEGFLPALCSSQAGLRPGGKTNIKVVRFGLGDENIHVKHDNNIYIKCIDRSRMFFAGQR
jgi:hypothetical protein